MRVEKTLIQTFSCQLSSTLIQLMFSSGKDMRVEKSFIITNYRLSTLINSHATLVLFDQDIRVERTLTNSRLSTLINYHATLVLFDQDTRVEKTLTQTFSCQLSCSSCAHLTKICRYKLSLVNSRTTFVLV